jgi:hypothetical protein
MGGGFWPPNPPMDTPLIIYIYITLRDLYAQLSSLFYTDLYLVVYLLDYTKRVTLIVIVHSLELSSQVPIFNNGVMKIPIFLLLCSQVATVIRRILYPLYYIILSDIII